MLFFLILVDLFIGQARHTFRPGLSPRVPRRGLLLQAIAYAGECKATRHRSRCRGQQGYDGAPTKVTAGPSKLSIIILDEMMKYEIRGPEKLGQGKRTT